jgi:uncharacterized protein (DUF427 family)
MVTEITYLYQAPFILDDSRFREVWPIGEAVAAIAHWARGFRRRRRSEMASGPGYQKHPEHRVETRPARARVQVTSKGELIADSEDAVRLDETGYDPVYYLPRRDAKMDQLRRSAHRSHCPFKGDASYFSLPGAENAVWSYEEPYDEVRAIKDRLAFYRDKVTISVTPAA